MSSSACNLALTAGDLSRRAVANESRVAVVSNLQYINNANNQRVHRIPSAERPSPSKDPDNDLTHPPVMRFMSASVNDSPVMTLLASDLLAVIMCDSKSSGTSALPSAIFFNRACTMSSTYGGTGSKGTAASVAWTTGSRTQQRPKDLHVLGMLPV